MSEESADERPTLPPERWEKVLWARYEQLVQFFGRASFPCFSSAAPLIREGVQKQLRGFGRELDDTGKASLDAVIAEPLRRGSANPDLRYQLVVEFKSDGATLHRVDFKAYAQPLDAYSRWVERRSGPLFGPLPDAKVIQIALGSGLQSKILDVGAGIGRNAIPLARLGFAVDALERHPDFLAGFRQVLTQAFLEPLTTSGALRVLEMDFFDPSSPFPRAPYDLVVMSELIASHARDEARLAEFLHRGAELLRPGGRLLMNVFLPEQLLGEEVELSPLLRELGAYSLCAVHSYSELNRVLSSAHLTIESDEPALAFERAAMPAESWPPTPWYESWADGRNLLPLKSTLRSPFQLRWILLRKDN